MECYQLVLCNEVRVGSSVSSLPLYSRHTIASFLGSISLLRLILYVQMLQIVVFIA